MVLLARRDKLVATVSMELPGQRVETAFLDLLALLGLAAFQGLQVQPEAAGSVLLDQLVIQVVMASKVIGDFRDHREGMVLEGQARVSRVLLDLQVSRVPRVNREQAALSDFPDLKALLAAVQMMLMNVLSTMVDVRIFVSTPILDTFVHVEMELNSFNVN